MLGMIHRLTSTSTECTGLTCIFILPPLDTSTRRVVGVSSRGWVVVTDLGVLRGLSDCSWCASTSVQYNLLCGVHKFPACLTDGKTTLNYDYVHVPCGAYSACSVFGVLASSHVFDVEGSSSPSLTRTALKAVSGHRVFSVDNDGLTGSLRTSLRASLVLRADLVHRDSEKLLFSRDSLHSPADGDLLRCSSRRWVLVCTFGCATRLFLPRSDRASQVGNSFCRAPLSSGEDGFSVVGG